MTVLTFGSEAPLIPAIPAGGGTLRVRISPLISDGNGNGMYADPDAISEPRMDMQQVLTNLRAAATRAAGLVRDNDIAEIRQPHRHPKGRPCLRCAVSNASRNDTVASTLLEVLVLESGSTEEWNLSRECNYSNTATRLRRLAVREETLEELYGPYWSEVMVCALRIENTDFAMIRYLIDKFRATKDMPIDVDSPKTRNRLAAYHLGTIALPNYYRNGEEIPSMQRNRALHAIGTAMGDVAVGMAPGWFDHLNEPAL